ncbi:MAG: CPBP family intramembrane metalloprotease [Actinomycetota bacterium]|nr:CPBP family intramembrane metalloprotease [Actinomycetota bacterium]
MSISDLILAALVVALPLYNLLANRWPPFNQALFVPMNLALAAVVVGLGLGAMDLTSEEVFGSFRVGGAAMGFLLGVLVTLPLFGLAFFDRTASVVHDERVAHLSGSTLAYQVLVRIPLGTALVEEVVFRGVLFAAWRDAGTVRAAIFSSIVFGLWHIGPTINLVEANKPEASPLRTVRTIAGAVVFTTAAGVLFCWLRVRAGLAGPIAMHATVNGLATLASVLAARRVAARASCVTASSGGRD